VNAEVRLLLVVVVIPGIPDKIIVRKACYAIFQDLNADEDSDHLYGNYGLQDQITALKWVHKYIHSFGGDNKKVRR